jgi:hypothetical protein
MSNERKREFSGPIEENDWPDKLKAHVVTPGPRPRIHGYDVEGDLARHYSFAETILLTLTGEPPEEETGKAFEIALQFLAPISIAEAPAHAAMLARMCGAEASGVTQVGTTALAEQARSTIDGYTSVLESLERVGLARKVERGPAPASERAAIELLGQHLARVGFDSECLSGQERLDGAILCLLQRIGLRKRWQLEAAFVVCRLPAVVAEAFAVTPGEFKDYPMDLPPFEYEAS